MKSLIFTAVLVLATLTGKAAFASSQITMCTLALVPLYNPDTRDVVVAKDGCQAAQLMKQGYVRGTAQDLKDMEDKKNDGMRICHQGIRKLYNPKTKEFVDSMNGCQEEDLRKAGYIDAAFAPNDNQNSEQNTQEENKAHLSVITQGSYTVQPANFCPAGRVCVPNNLKGPARSQIVLLLPLRGCLDSAHMTYKISEDRKTVYVSALNIGNEESKAAFCLVAPTARKTINLDFAVSKKEDIKIEFLKDIAQ